MGLFNFFKRKEALDVADDQNEELITFVENDDAQMLQAFADARATFPYFWRELSWENRRIIPALSIASIKAAFSQEQAGAEPIIEHMWLNDIYFDGEAITGCLINEPHELTNVEMNDQVTILLSDVEDWLLSDGEVVCGGFTIQAMRSMMNGKEREEHDEAWGLPFNQDYSVSLTLFDEGDLSVHPMDENMREPLSEFLKEHPDEITNRDESGNSMLIRETIAGNIASVQVLLENGADTTVKNNYGKTAEDYAKLYGWHNLAKLFSEKNATVH